MSQGNPENPTNPGTPGWSQPPAGQGSASESTPENSSARWASSEPSPWSAAAQSSAPTWGEPTPPQNQSPGQQANAWGQPATPQQPSSWPPPASGTQAPTWGQPSPVPGQPGTWGQPAAGAGQPSPWGQPPGSNEPWGTGQPSAPGQAWGQPAPSPQGSYPAPGSYTNPSNIPQATGPENVGRGILWASASVLIGAAATILLAQVGFVSSLSAWFAAAAALWLYTRGAGAPPRKGAGPLIGVVAVGVVVQFFALIGSSLWRAYRGPGGTSGRWQFVLNNLFNLDAMGDYLFNGLMLLVFAALGVYAILRQLSARK